jgi:hypothetical protein
MEYRVTPLFTQSSCAVAPTTSDGNLKKGAGYFPCTVQVTEHAVLITTGNGERLDHAQAGSVQIVTPGWQRRVGAGSIISMDGKQPAPRAFEQCVINL